MEGISVIWFLITLLSMGFFSGIEMAFYSADRKGLSLEKKKYPDAYRLVNRYYERPDRFLATTGLGWSLLLVALCLQVSGVAQLIWAYFQIDSDTGRILVEIGWVSLLVLCFVEFIPRALFSAHANRLLLVTAPVFGLLHKLLGPVAIGLMNLTQWALVYIFNIRVDPAKETLHRAAPQVLLTLSADNEREERTAQLIENARELPNLRIRQCLVPRKEVIGIEQGASIEKLKQQFIDTKLSRLVVYRNSIDHIVGYVHQLDLFSNPASISEILYPIPAVPESMSAVNLIAQFTRERKSIAWVVDEFGGTAGIITMEDVLEELFGEIQDEYDTEEQLEKKISEDDYIFSGRIELDYLGQKYGLDLRHEEAETLSGYIINYHEKIPQKKERITIADYEFEILQVSDTRIETVRVKRLR
jgi:CBS domain containing-hemolysin-like protein